MNEAERLASEATRLLNEPLLVEALNDLMADAFAEFKDIAITPDTLPALIKLQARANAPHDLLDALKAKIVAAGQHDGGVTVETKPTA